MNRSSISHLVQARACQHRSHLARSARLVVEVDGGYHASRRTADARRDHKLARLRYRVLRIDAELVRRSPEEALALVRRALAP